MTSIFPEGVIVNQVVIVGEQQPRPQCKAGWAVNCGWPAERERRGLSRESCRALFGPIYLDDAGIQDGRFLPALQGAG